MDARLRQVEIGPDVEDQLPARSRPVRLRAVRVRAGDSGGPVSAAGPRTVIHPASSQYVSFVGSDSGGPVSAAGPRTVTQHLVNMCPSWAVILEDQ